VDGIDLMNHPLVGNTGRTARKPIFDVLARIVEQQALPHFRAVQYIPSNEFERIIRVAEEKRGLCEPRKCERGYADSAKRLSGSGSSDSIVERNFLGK
jgi:hypothetical protein